ncbi:MAG: TetR/AcrR family transcriptional regulator [Gammaproteobacteria bacterium]|nr:TetR/AcrR family transcriptional regulator [Gammaproteobacteria bacterium]
MIAARAKVSTQTVYNHFPEFGQLLGACTGHVLARAPVLNADTIRPGKSPKERLQLLGAAVCEQQAFLAPWMRLGWHEARVIPELGRILDSAHDALRDLIAQCVLPERTASPDFVSAALALLEYPGWSQLAQGRTPRQTAALMAACLTALLPELTQPTRQEPK